MKTIVLSAVALLIVACAGNPAVVGNAEQQCQARGLTPGTAAFEGCVDRAVDTTYKGWGRDHLNKGD